MNIKELFEVKDKLESMTKDTFDIKFRFKVIIIHNYSKYTEYIHSYSDLTEHYPINPEKELSKGYDSYYMSTAYIYKDDTYDISFILTLERD